MARRITQRQTTLRWLETLASEQTCGATLTARRLLFQAEFLQAGLPKQLEI
jgi:hypothetical protein